MSSPIKTLFDHHAKHWMNTSMEHLENIIKQDLRRTIKFCRKNFTNLCI